MAKSGDGYSLLGDRITVYLLMAAPSHYICKSGDAITAMSQVKNITLNKSTYYLYNSTVKPILATEVQCMALTMFNN